MHQSQTSLSMTSPTPQRSIWGAPPAAAATTEDNNASIHQSPVVGPPSVYQASPSSNTNNQKTVARDVDDPALITGMSGLSLLNAASNTFLSSSTSNQLQFQSSNNQQHYQNQSNHNNNQSNHHQQQQKQLQLPYRASNNNNHHHGNHGMSAGASVQSNYSHNLPGLVQSSSESTTSLPTIATPYYPSMTTTTSTTSTGKDKQQEANTILHTSLRSFLDDDDDTVDNPPMTTGEDDDDDHNNQQSHPQPPGFQHPNALRSPGAPGHGNASTRKNRQRNKIRMQKKRQEAKQPGTIMNMNNEDGIMPVQALKERNNIVVAPEYPDSVSGMTGTNPLYPLYEKQQRQQQQQQMQYHHPDAILQSPASSKRAVVGQQQQQQQDNSPSSTSQALRMLTSPAQFSSGGEPTDYSSPSSLNRSVLELESSFLNGSTNSLRLSSPMPPPISPGGGGGGGGILPKQLPTPPPLAGFGGELSFSSHYPNTAGDNSNHSEDEDDLILKEILASEHKHRLQQQQQQQQQQDGDNSGEAGVGDANFMDDHPSTRGKKREWLLRMNKKLQEVPVGELDPSVVPINAILDAWAKTKSAQGASMVELWLKRAQEEYGAGNHRIVPTTKMYTMAGMFRGRH